NTTNQKIKQKEGNLTITLEPTTDILKELGSLKKQNQFLVGFALETNDEINHAKEKLIRKNLDLIILNSLKDKGAGFGTDTNKISIINKDNKLITFELKSKKELAFDILSTVENQFLNS
ncbi:MAG: phosphopantothenoylcysteine decarboxylase, partial [Flavobacteriales bacterium]|nr:phosphopantothenoylcysteine decarboxylase [Flavobacteriales bacterium]